MGETVNWKKNTSSSSLMKSLGGFTLDLSSALETNLCVNGSFFT